MSLYPFQETCLKFHLAHHYSLNFCEMGLGKTRIALALAKSLGVKPEVFGPAFLRSNWLREAAGEGVETNYHPYSKLPTMIPSKTLWVADEVHYLKNPTAKRTHQFYSLLKEIRPEYFLGLTGTPIKNRIPDLWTLLGFCGLNMKGTSGKVLSGHLTKYYAFANHFCHVKEQRFGGRVVQKFLGLREDRRHELLDLLKDKMIRFRVEEVLKDLPPMTRIPVKVDIGLEEVGGLAAQFAAYMAGSKVGSTAKAQSALLKAPSTVEYCVNILDSGSGPLVVYTDHLDSAKLIAKGLGTEAVTGGTPADERAVKVAAFQAGEIPALVATVGSLSVGVNLTAARHVIFNDLSWTPSDNDQAAKRIHRIGQKDASFSHYIESTPTDSYIRRVLLEKADTARRIIP